MAFCPGLEQQTEFNSKQGLTIVPNQGQGDELDIEEVVEQAKKSQQKQDKPENNDYTEEKSDQELAKLEAQIKTYYQRILFFSFLTKDRVASLDDILSALERDENISLSKNLLLDKAIIQKISKSMDPFKRSRLDYKIQNISMLACDESVAPLTRALRSIKKFSRMSESEVITPSKLCDEMVGYLPEESLKEIVSNQDKLLDIASKSGEYAVALYKRLTSELGYSHENVKNIIYSIPTSSIAYEFTKRFYEILDLNVENIATKFNAYDLVKVKNDKDEVDYEKISGILKQNKKFSDITLPMWMHKKYLEPHDNFEFYKVFVPAANGSGALGEVLSTPVIGYPVIGYTQTFISLGKFKTEQEAEALLKYIKSKFARLMLGLKKTTQNNKTKKTWSKIPMQDFTEKSDIDWTKSIVEIDEQLFDKYNLSIEERQHIKKSIKDM
ncbi:hypothetical protein [Mesomycoplasma ovipneumoniae]|uniref:hypothetical protein n=1 Tax=Mesomycoplasma ovipneumoniae TaxID=29562 RepID=UPI002964FDC8|nr:hypothetical protein [Mesomycoplasma ovipneumoniae]MDW2929750.1 hypothetical protein [Mesomycoplasma ovipneumoniae]